MRRVEDYTKFQNCHRGETGLIVANGPSLEDVPIDFMKQYTSFGVNRITGMTPDFVPTYYSCIGFNQLDTPEKRDTIHVTLAHDDCKAAFINRLFAHFFPYDNVWGVKGMGEYNKGEDPFFFSLDPLNIIGLRATMVFVCLQIAYYMGFQRILLVGLDHNYPEGTKKHFYDDSEFPDFESAPGPHYDNNPLQWQLVATEVLALAEEVYKDAGREIINLTDGTACPVFRKEALSAFYNPS